MPASFIAKRATETARHGSATLHSGKAATRIQRSRTSFGFWRSAARLLRTRPARVAHLRKPPIRRHETLNHRGDQLARLRDQGSPHKQRDRGEVQRVVQPKSSRACRLRAVQALACRVADIADQPVAAFATAVRKVVTAHRLGLPTETLGQIGCISGIVSSGTKKGPPSLAGP